MIQMRTITAIFWKQLKDSVKNIPVLVLFVVYPIIAIIMGSAIAGEMGEAELFISLFGTMHAVFTPIVTTASILSEEKEKNTLRVLIFANVNPVEYMLSIGSFVLLCTFCTSALFFVGGQFTMAMAARFLLAQFIGSMVSVLLGLTLGAYAKNMAGANGLAVPAGMVFAFLPMLSAFNETIGSVSRFTYGQQISNIMMGTAKTGDAITVIAINFLLFLVAFYLIYRRNRLDL
ncbi:ABC transporter permease [Anaerolentibacter hominis]|uniref:ABC transporter permease n=1 Tax=Anaerolentibacter hominis TaxID=3079009 RepID=UPI0031B88CFE